MSGWTHEEEAYLARAYPDTRIPIGEIAERLGKHPKTVIVHANGRGMFRNGQKPKTPTTARPCLCCGRQFKSEGIHHRLCGDCRHRSEGLI